jgi:hypothetical protein
MRTLRDTRVRVYGGIGASLLHAQVELKLPGHVEVAYQGGGVVGRHFDKRPHFGFHVIMTGTRDLKGWRGDFRRTAQQARLEAAAGTVVDQDAERKPRVSQSMSGR